MKVCMYVCMYVTSGRIENPNWQEVTSWLFTSVAEDLNSRPPTTNIILQVARAGLEPGTAGFRFRRAEHSATLPPLRGSVEKRF